ncbi:helix-turn-helix domain-containing protein [Streptomyces sp. JL7001]|uniref:helix-turn-helix domain-containing protein n=1 Tax=Streptomyces sp. JL7001 TaxID=3445784 RepID=UPI003F792425
MPIAVDIDVMLARRKMSVGELAERVGITPANLAVLKNGRAKAVRFATLAALCEVLECQPGDLLRWEAEEAAAEEAAAEEAAAEEAATEEAATDEATAEEATVAHPE